MYLISSFSREQLWFFLYTSRNFLRAKLHPTSSIRRNAIQSSNWLWRVASLNFISQPFLTSWIAVLCIAFSSLSAQERRRISYKNRRAKFPEIAPSTTEERVLALLTKWLWYVNITVFISQPALMSVAAFTFQRNLNVVKKFQRFTLFFYISQLN